MNTVDYYAYIGHTTLHTFSKINIIFFKVSYFTSVYLVYPIYFYVNIDLPFRHNTVWMSDISITNSLLPKLIGSPYGSRLFKRVYLSRQHIVKMRKDWLVQIAFSKYMYHRKWSRVEPHTAWIQIYYKHYTFLKIDYNT